MAYAQSPPADDSAPDDAPGDAPDDAPGDAPGDNAKRPAPREADADPPIVDPSADVDPESLLAEEIERLVAQLDGATLRERQQAERSLIELGPEILRWLPRENALPTAEMRQRLHRVILQLQKQRSTVSIDATPVTIDGAISLGEALKQITRQTKIEFSMVEQAAQPMSITLKKVPCWAAIDEVLDRSKLDVDVFGGKAGEIRLVPRNERRPSRSDNAAYSGVFRIEPTGVLSRRNLINGDLSGLDVTIEVAWELQLTPIGISFPLAEFTATLDNGDELKVQPSAETVESTPNPGVWTTETSIPFLLPAGQPVKIDTLEGKIDALLPGPTKRFDFDLKQTTFPPREAGDVTVTLDQVAKRGELHEVRVSVKFNKADRALESHRAWVFDNPAYIVATAEAQADNEKALRHEHLGLELYRQTSDEIGIGYLYDMQGDPSKFHFRYETPQSIIRSELRFTLHDIHLP